MIGHFDPGKEVMKATNLAMRKPQSLEALGVTATNLLKRMLSHPGSGESYGNHRASAPGEPPAVDTGRLRNSIDYALGTESTGAYVDVGTNVDYAPPLEHGTSRMAARPFMRPATEETKVLFAAAAVEVIVAAQVRAIASMPREIIIE
jgi:HK97 gp10 family phage protein